jgi:hypothetical protein
MKPRTIATACLHASLLLLAAVATAAEPKPGSASTAARKADAVAKPASTPTTAGQTTAPRTLDDIHIEGEIAVPQVLFITARDQRRILDFQHRRYLETSRQIGEGASFPTRIALLPNPTIETRKEIR